MGSPPGFAFPRIVIPARGHVERAATRTEGGDANTMLPGPAERGRSRADLGMSQFLDRRQRSRNHDAQQRRSGADPADAARAMLATTAIEEHTWVLKMPVDDRLSARASKHAGRLHGRGAGGREAASLQRFSDESRPRWGTLPHANSSQSVFGKAALMAMRAPDSRAHGKPCIAAHATGGRSRPSIKNASNHDEAVP
jgi:hypothetical protein